MRLIIAIAAAFCFGAAVIRTQSRVDLVALGLLLLTIALVVPL